MLRYGRLLILALLFVAVALCTLWGAAMLYFTEPGGVTAGMVLAAVFAAAGVAALIAIMSGRRRGATLGVFAVALIAAFAWWNSIEPSNDRQWKPEVAKTPYAVFDGDRVTIHNIRNFEYRSETDFTPAWYDATYDLNELDGVDVIASYWAGPDIAHIFLSFGFRDGRHLAVSIERRDETTEGYSTVRGLFRQYELFYVVADERDLIRLRTNFRADPPEDVYVYPVVAKPQNLRPLFMEYLREINSLNEHPEFYNTATTNCTSNIWLHTRVNPGHLPYSWKIFLSGHVPEYLYENGLVDTNLPFDELRAKSRVNDAARAHGDDPEFSRAIRAGLPGMPH